MAGMAHLAREAAVTEVIDLARLTGRGPNDPILTQLFDALVLRGHLTPWLPNWWELIRWSRARKIVARWEMS